MFNVKNFSLKHTFESGQPLNFHADYSHEGAKESLKYVTCSGAFSATCTQVSEGSQRITYNFKGEYSRNEARDEITKRLGLGDDMEKIYGAIGTDKFMNEAIRALYGMRLTRNDPWETSLCYIISQFNNIKRIRQIVKRLIERFGEKRDDGVRFFPLPEAVAEASDVELRGCGTGFRARYIKDFAEACASKEIDLDSLGRIPYADAKALLMGIDGIGDKVSDCILLFSCGKQDAFPIDVWVKRTLEQIYFQGKPQKIPVLHEFAERRWKGYGGYAQQYLFHYARTKKSLL